MRLLHQRHDHVREGTDRQQAEYHRSGHPLVAGRKSLSLRNAQSRYRRRAARRQADGHPADSAQAGFRSAAYGRALTMNAPILTRRTFAQGMGGIVLAFSLAPTSALLAQGAAPPLPGSLNNNRTLDAWFRINADGTATVFTGKVELGQGILTALAQIAAEEIDLPISRLTMVSGDTGRTPDEGQTAGSQSIENSGTALRLAGAEVRAILLDLAAKKLDVSVETLKVSNGTISAADGRNVTYGQLAAEADFKREATAKVKPKNPST